MSRKLTTHSKQHGFAMMEALVTAVILAIAISGVGVLLLRSMQATHDSSQLSQGMWIVQDFVGRMRANSPAMRSGDYLGTVSTDDCGIQPAKMCGSYNFENDIIPAAIDCTPAEMATYDGWITICGLDDEVYDAPADFIVNPVLNNTCLQQDGIDCVRYNVDLSWYTKLKKGSADVDERKNENNYSMVIEVN